MFGGILIPYCHRLMAVLVIGMPRKYSLALYYFPTHVAGAHGRFESVGIQVPTGV